MENLALKIRLSVLWLVEELIVVVGAMLSIFEPGLIEQVIAGEVEGMQITPELLLVFAIVLLVPLVMAVLSLTLKDSTNRWVNIISGIVFTGIGILDLIELLLGIRKPSAYAILMTISGIVATALIAWYAYKWPKEEV